MNHMEADIWITENTVGWINDTDIGVSNLWCAQYVLPNGEKRFGPTAQLTIGEGLNFRVGKESEFTVRNQVWMVRTIQFAQENPDKSGGLMVARK